MGYSPAMPRRPKNQSAKSPQTLTLRLVAALLAPVLLCACSGGGGYRERSLSASLDTRVEPCQDFYQYACGGWLDRVSLPPDQSLWRRSFSAMQRDSLRTIESLIVDAQGSPTPSHEQTLISHYFESCLNERAAEDEGLTWLASYLEQADSINGVDDALFLSGQLRKTLASPLIVSAIWPDYAAPDRNLLHLAQSGLGMGAADLYLDGNTDRVSAYRDYIESMLGHFGETNAANLSRAIVRFESALARLWSPLAVQRDPRASYNPIEPARWMDGRYADAINAYARGLGVALPQWINITGPAYFDALIGFLDSAPVADLRAYFRWRIIDAHRPLLDKKARRIAFSFFGGELQGLKRPPLRRHECIVMTHQALGEAVGRLFIETRFSAQEKLRARSLAESLQDALIAQLESADWMAPDDHQAALKKARHLRFKLGYPNQWRGYDALTLVESSPLRATLNVREFENADHLARLGQPVDPNRWMVDVFQVNAYYNATANEAVFPAGILQPPLFDAAAPSAANFGAIGSVMAHEISHGFDANGSHFGFDGRLHGGWQLQTESAFESHKACVGRHFESQHSVAHNGALTLPENMADLAGLRLAWRAWLAHKETEPSTYAATALNPEQLFFVSFAQSWCSLERKQSADIARQVDPHSEARVRVNGSVSGLSDFAEVFACPLGAPMNPMKRCEP